MASPLLTVRRRPRQPRVRFLTHTNITNIADAVTVVTVLVILDDLGAHARSIWETGAGKAYATAQQDDLTHVAHVAGMSRVSTISWRASVPGIPFISVAHGYAVYDGDARYARLAQISCQRAAIVTSVSPHFPLRFFLLRRGREA